LIHSTPPQYYSAHQKARTSASRLCKPPTSRKPDYDGAIELLFESARELLKAGESGSGTDLAGYMIEVEEMKGGVSLSDPTRGNPTLYIFVKSHHDIGTERICQLIALTGSEGTWRKIMIDKSLAYVWIFTHEETNSSNPVFLVSPINSAHILQAIPNSITI
jgi:hypothetical protein